MPIGLFGAMVGIGALGQLASGIKEADAMERRSLALQRAATPSVEELASIQRLLQTREESLAQMKQTIQNNRQLVEAVDPAIKAAGEEAYRLISGEESRALAPIRRERERQRQRVQNQLAQRLGSGWRTSSAGIEAMQRFEDETFGQLAEAQRKSTETFLGASIQARPDLTRDVGAFASIGQSFDTAALAADQNIANRRMAGAESVGVGEQARAGVMGDLFGSLGSVGATQLGLRQGTIMGGVQGGVQSGGGNAGNQTMENIFGS